jgi:hypothetical protein
MDANRFDMLTRVVPAGKSRRRTVMAALGGSLAALSLGTSSARKKKCKKRKPCPTCATCAAPTTCPPRDTCPARTCFVCHTSSPTPGCRLAPATPPDQDLQMCRDVCGGPYSVVGTARGVGDGSTYACNAAGNACVGVGCPV